MDGWGGALSAAIRGALSGHVVGATTLRARTVGQRLEKRGDVEVRATGATLEDEAEGEYTATPDSSLLLMREGALVTVRVADSGDDDDRVNLYAVAVECRATLLEEGWLDPSFEWQEPTYPEADAGVDYVFAGFNVTARTQARLA